MFSFKPNEKIFDRQFLFGRNGEFQELDSLLNTIYRGTNCQLQGERRFGKSSILNCTYKELSETNKHNIIPLLVDFKKEQTYKGTSNVYRYLLSCFICNLTSQGFFENDLKIRNVTIKPCKVIEDCFEVFKSIEDFRIQGLFEDFILHFSKLLEASFVLLIDEYEYLMTQSLDSPEGFVTIRNLSEYPRDVSYKPLTYIIAGSKSWDVLCTQIGSPELNNQGASIIYVGSIERKDFDEMLDFYYKDFEEINKFPDLTKKSLYDLSGGIPYYAKKIGESVITRKNNRITYQLLKNEFDSIYKNLEEYELRIIFDVSKNNPVKEGNVLYNLQDRGIIRNEGNNFGINGTLLKKYFQDKFSTEDKFEFQKELEGLNTIVENIFNLIEIINKNYKNKNHGDYLFEPVVTENTQRSSLKFISKKKSDFQLFINTLYTIIFERTADRSRGKRFRIPQSYREHDCVKRIDSLRQEFIHLTDSKAFIPRANQFKAQDLYQFYLNKTSTPEDHELYRLQAAVLDDFKLFLTRLEVFYK